MNKCAVIAVKLSWLSWRGLCPTGACHSYCINGLFLVMLFLMRLGLVGTKEVNNSQCFGKLYMSIVEKNVKPEQQ